MTMLIATVYGLPESTAKTFIRPFLIAYHNRALLSGYLTGSYSLSKTTFLYVTTKPPENKSLRKELNSTVGLVSELVLVSEPNSIQLFENLVSCWNSGKTFEYCCPSAYPEVNITMNEPTVPKNTSNEALMRTEQLLESPMSILDSAMVKIFNGTSLNELVSHFPNYASTVASNREMLANYELLVTPPRLTFDNPLELFVQESNLPEIIATPNSSTGQTPSTTN